MKTKPTQLNMREELYMDIFRESVIYWVSAERRNWAVTALRKARSGEEKLAALEIIISEERQPTEYIQANFHPFTQAFHKADYTEGDVKFLKASRFPGRNYFLYSDTAKDFTHTWGANGSSKKMTVGPLHLYSIAKGTRLTVQGFRNYSTGTTDGAMLFLVETPQGSPAFFS